MTPLYAARCPTCGQRLLAAHDTMTLGDAAELLHVSHATLRQWCNVGRLPSARTPGGHRRVLRADVEAFARELLPTRQCVAHLFCDDCEDGWLDDEHDEGTARCSSCEGSGRVRCSSLGRRRVDGRWLCDAHERWQLR